MSLRNRAVIVSDLHLGTKDSRTGDFLRFLEEHPSDLLILNGDIIDGWALKRGSKWKKRHTEVVSRLIKLSLHTKIVWVRGNHDEFIEDFLGYGFGGISIVDHYVLPVEGKRYYVFHGDLIDVFMTKWKWLSKLGSIGYDFALWINRWYNRWRIWRGLSYYSLSKRIKDGVKTATNYINDFETAAVREAAKHGCVGVICGHIHKPCSLHTQEGHYLNTGDWVENRSAVIVDSSGKIFLWEMS
jgi:UDP-2,3-diacylglucosamine pyrophosphatase LpxH